MKKKNVTIYNINIDKTDKFNILVTYTAGLEEVVISELLFYFPNCTIKDQLHGKLIFQINVPLANLFLLRCVDNIYVFLNDFHIGFTRNDLNKLTSNIFDFSVVNELYLETFANASIVVNASRSGDHTYSRFEIEELILDLLVKKYGFAIGTNQTHDLNFRIDVIDNKAFLSLKITPASFRFRYTQRKFSVGAIRPTIAHSLIKLSKPNKNDVFLDPFCGSGTIVSERENYPVKKIIATDKSLKAVNAAKSNVSSEVVVYQADACDLKIKSNTISKIVTNLPWDEQINVDDLTKLYNKFLSESARLLIDDGIMIALTDKKTYIYEAAQYNNLAIKELANLSLHGLHPSIFKISKKI